MPPRIDSRRYKALRTLIKVVGFVLAGWSGQGRVQRALYRLLGGAPIVLAPRYDKKLVALAALSLDRVLNGADHKRFDKNNFFPLLFRHAHPGTCVIDVGAGMGDEVLDLSQLVGPDGFVLAFEPNPNAFAALGQTVAANDLRNVRAVPQAVGAEKGFLSTQGGIASWTVRKMTDGGEGAIPVTTLDAVYAEHSELFKSKGLSLIKIDTDGFDLDVLRGARRLLADFPAAKVVVEFLPSISYSGLRGREVLDELERMGFLINAIQTAAVPLTSPEAREQFLRLFTDARQMICHDVLLERR